MALVVESTSFNSVSDSSSLTVTKPTGVQVGDLLLIATWTKDIFGSGPTCSGFSIAASLNYDAPGAISNVGAYLLYRIADSSDVSASNYSIDTNSGSATDNGSAAMYRISGWTTGNPVWATSGASANQDATSFTLTASGLSIIRPNSALIISINAFISNSSPLSLATFSGYSITSGVANPSWTEVCDVAITIESGTVKVSFSTAYANTTDLSNITAFSVTGATDISGTEDSEVSLLCVLVAPNSPTVDVSHLAVTPTIESVTASAVTVVADVSHLTVTPTLNGIEAIDSSDSTQWINETKPTATSWINQDK